jgi:hypothetical protein
LSTGDSLDMSLQDEAAILANDATLKDMEVLQVQHIHTHATELQQNHNKITTELKEYANLQS